jgi:tetratricopeptide (TPR) repeat protein
MMKRLVTTSIGLLVLTLTVSVCGQQADKHQVYRLSLPNKNWALEIPLGDFYDVGVKTDISRVDLAIPPLALLSGPTESLSDEGEYSLLAFQRTHKEKAFAYARLHVRLRPALRPGGALEFRDFALKELDRRNYVSRSLKTWEHGQIPVARYTLLSTHDAGNGYTGPIPQTESGPRNLEAYFVKDNTWITLTFAASPFDKAEEDLFDSLIESVTFVDTSSPSTSYDYYQKGKLLFLNKEYFAASQALEAAFALEQRQRQLELPFWRDLVGKLADSYGVLVNRTKAKEVLEYGVDNDPANTTLLMGLARLYASEGDIDNTLSALERAAHLFKNAVPRRSLPDLSYDPAFARLMKVEQFRKGLKAIKK